MKKRTYPPKRTTLLSLLLRAVSAVTVLTLVFAFGSREYLRQTVRQQCNEQLAEQILRMQRYINVVQGETSPQLRMQEINAKMSMYLYFDILVPDYLSREPDNSFAQIVSQYSPGSYAAAALVGEDGTAAASSRQKLVTFLRFRQGDDPDRGFYVCDPDALRLPELEPLLQAYRDMSRSGSPDAYDSYVEMQLNSAYVNRETRSFVPHEVTLRHGAYKPDGSPLVEIDWNDVQSIQITADLPGYELTELHQGTGDDYPRSIAFGFYGIPAEQMELFDDLFTYGAQDRISRGTAALPDAALYSRNVPVYLDGAHYYLNVRLLVNEHDPLMEKLYRKWVIVFAAVLTLIAVLWVWHRHVLNKAKYAFEDSQRDLTDHLAHDIKTPLTAISGYAENVLHSGLSADEQQQYLHAILENVRFTDSLVSRTLYLNHMGEGRAAKPEPVQLAALAEDVLRKYALLLEEQQISYRVTGSAEISADRAVLETILENLTSNAVKYTPMGGTIGITIGKKRLTVANSVAGKIDTRELKRPFVRGDAARSNSGGNGLGLAIAERAALSCGWRLNLSCTETEFKADLKL